MAWSTQLAQAGAEWREAWRGRNANPLNTVWPAAEARRKARLPWLRRSPGLAVLGTLIALVATAANGFLLIELIRLPEVTPRHAYAYVSGGAVQLFVGAALFAACWYLARLYGVLQSAYGFLDSTPRRRLDAALDDQLLLTALSGPDILLACVQQALRRVMPPLLVLAALVALDTVRLEWAGALEHSQAIAVSALVGDALLQFIMLTVSAMVTVPALVLLAIGLSRGRHAAFLPSIGAGVLVGLQPVLAYCSSFPLAAQLTDKASPLVPIAACLLISLPILAALLAVSESQSGLRSLLLVGLPAVWMGSQVLPGDFIARWLRLDFTGPLTPLIACSYLTPLNCSGWLTYVVDGFLQPRDMLPVWLCQLPFQLALLFLAAWFALRAISLRKRGAA